MPRETWPYALDREIIDRWLEGKPKPNHDAYDESMLTTADKTIILAGFSIMWTDTAGAVCVKCPTSHEYKHYAMPLVEYVCDKLGITDRFVREENPEWTSPGKPELIRFKYFFAGQEIVPDVPWVLCGPLTVQAYRAGLRK
jgi:hypothetical protein